MLKHVTTFLEKLHADLNGFRLYRLGVEKTKEIRQKIVQSPLYIRGKEKFLTHPWVVAAIQKFNTLEWKEKIILCMCACGLFLFFVGPCLLLYRESQTLIAETEKRGENLARLLAASNQVALTENKAFFFSTTFVINELGVQDAWVVDLQKNVMAPSERFGQTLDNMSVAANPQGCSRWSSGLHYQFACPIYKWVEANNGFQKQVLGYAYVDYTAAAALNAVSYRKFEFFKYGTWFVLCFGFLGYFVIQLTTKPILDFKFGLRAFARGASQEFPEPTYFSELKDLSLEVREFAGAKPAVVHAQSTASDTDVFALVSPYLKENMVYIDSDKRVSFVSDALKKKLGIDDNQHLLRAFQNSPFSEHIVNFIAKAMDANTTSMTETVDGLGAVELRTFTQKNKNHYFMLFNA